MRAVTWPGMSDKGTAVSASVPDTARTAMKVLAPTLAVGVIARRPRVFGLADRFDADLVALRHMQGLAKRYGPGPLRLRVPGRKFALVLSPEHVRQVLDRSPEPFALANLEKRYALAHFQPRGVLISGPDHRAERRHYNDTILDSGHELHQLAQSFTDVIRDETDRLSATISATGGLTADQFVTVWWRIIRRVVLGDGARDDHEISDMLSRLRRGANWGYVAPRRDRVYRRFTERLEHHLRRADPGSLAGVIACTSAGPDLDPLQQIPQWLFAYDPAGLATLRTLALLSSHPEQAEAAREEVDRADLDKPAQLPVLRSDVMESVRLWPTTPAILRETTTETRWPQGTLPAGTGLLIWAPFFHRDDTVLPYAHRFAPHIWQGESGHGDWPLVPFSAGPGECPAKNLVLLTASTFLATLLQRHDFRLRHGDELDPSRPLPMTYSPYRLRFEARRVGPASSRAA